eukprot:8604698-Lingulodinium_polyedra.AAC.1
MIRWPECLALRGGRQRLSYGSAASSCDISAVRLQCWVRLLGGWSAQWHGVGVAPAEAKVACL